VALGLRQVEQGRSLDQVLPELTRQVRPAQRSVVQAISFEVLRHYEALVYWRDALLDRPLPAKSMAVAMLLLVGLERLSGSNREPSRVVNACVHAARELDQNWATGLVNAILRRAARQVGNETTPLKEAPSQICARLPDWLYRRLSEDWGEAQAIEIGKNLATHPPMTLRVNPRQTDVKAYQALLSKQGIESSMGLLPAPYALVLKQPVDVERLPGFFEGWVSVQDEAAQCAPLLMDLQPGLRVLDACAAPGGKTLAMLECEPDIEMIAMDHDPARLARVQDNLERGGFNAELLCADATRAESFSDQQRFDRILADVPCSATGVIRRHPDIKRLRRDDDIPALVQTQQKMLDTLWAQLRPGGRFVYATCSVLRAENVAQIVRFVQRRDDAHIRPIKADWGKAVTDKTGQIIGRQLFPQQDGHDGFFYAVLEKASRG